MLMQDVTALDSGRFQPGKEMIRCRQIARITLHMVNENTCIESNATMTPKETGEIL